MQNLLATLLAHASKRDEDAITATLAWMLRHHGPFREGFVRRLRRREGAAFPDRAPEVRTQLTEGSSRYDLVLSWPEVYAVVEVKVRAPLGWRSIDDEQGQVRHVSQVWKYLSANTASVSRTTWVYTLAADALDVEDAARSHDRYGGDLRWHEVRSLIESCEADDPMVSQVARWFVDVLKGRGMTYERLTKESLATVGPYLAMKRSLDAMIDRAWETLRTHDVVRSLAREPAWRQEAHARIGWAIPVSRRAGHVAFLGVSVHPLATRDGEPDLLFFLESPPAKPATQRIMLERVAWEDACAALDAEGTARWALGDGWPVISARRDMATLVDEADQVAAMTGFFRACVEALARHGLVARYLAACGVGETTARGG